MNVRKWLIVGLVTAVAAIGMAACADENPREPDVDIYTPEWTLRTYGPPASQTAVIPGTEITARFLDDGMSLEGSAGCNQYFGEYVIEDNNLTIGGLGWTETECSDPAGIMEQEQAYLSALPEIEEFDIDADTLTLSGPGVALVFAPADS